MAPADSAGDRRRCPDDDLVPAADAEMHLRDARRERATVTGIARDGADHRAPAGGTGR